DLEQIGISFSQVDISELQPSRRLEKRSGVFNETTFSTRRSDDHNSCCLPLSISNENLRLSRPGSGQLYSSAADSKLAGCFVCSQTSLDLDQDLSRQAPKYQRSH